MHKNVLCIVHGTHHEMNETILLRSDSSSTYTQTKTLCQLKHWHIHSLYRHPRTVDEPSDHDENWNSSSNKMKNEQWKQADARYTHSYTWCENERETENENQNTWNAMRKVSPKPMLAFGWSSSDCSRANIFATLTLLPFYFPVMEISSFLLCDFILSAGNNGTE